MKKKQNLSYSEISRETGHHRKTVKKYALKPKKQQKKHCWRTRKDPFDDVKGEIIAMLTTDPGLQGKTIFNYLCEKYPGKFSEGQLRSLQRRINEWRCLEGPAQEVMFEQMHRPGELAACDFTSMNALGVTIAGQPFEHKLFHFVLTYSNWENARICTSESFESLRSGIRGAFMILGKATKELLTDSLTAAVNNLGDRKRFQTQYEEFLASFGIKPRATQPRSPNENGDIEQRNRRLKDAVDQALMLRGSRNFASKEKYNEFLQKIIDRINSTRIAKLEEELANMQKITCTSMTEYTVLDMRVTANSTIRVKQCSYSVPSQLIGKKVEVRLFENTLEVWFSTKKILTCDRLRGEHKSKVDYRHIIDSLLKKPGAFAKFRYRDEMFPTITFRQAYEALCRENPLKASREYLQILHLAATDSETSVEKALKFLEKKETAISSIAVKNALGEAREKYIELWDVDIPLPSLADYDLMVGGCR